MGSNPKNQDEGRSDFAKAYGIASHIITSCILLVLPIGFGWWIDQRWGGGSQAIFTIVGLMLGMALGGWYAWRVLGPMMRSMMEPVQGPFRQYDDSNWEDDDEGEDRETRVEEEK